MSNRTPLVSKQNSEFVVYAKINEWERIVDGLYNVERIEKTNRNYLANIVSREKRLDSYQTSLTYLLFTGRYGLWMYEDAGSYVSFCWHPNLPGQILIFPPMGKKNFSAIWSLVKELPRPPRGFRVVRLSDSDMQHLNDSDLASPHDWALYQPVTEEILDWKYPVRILSTERVADMKEPAFKRTRNRIRHAEELMPHVEIFTFEHKDAVIEFVKDWAFARSSSAKEMCDYVSPYLAILDEFADPLLRLEGLVFFVNGRVKAFSVWDTPSNGMSIANRFANLCCEDCLGLSDYVMRAVAQKLHAKGIQLLNLGGSEMKGLDDYKNKFIPEFSIDLSSADVSEEIVENTYTKRTHYNDNLSYDNSQEFLLERIGL